MLPLALRFLFCWLNRHIYANWRWGLLASFCAAKHGHLHLLQAYAAIRCRAPPKHVAIASVDGIGTRAHVQPLASPLKKLQPLKDVEVTALRCLCTGPARTVALAGLHLWQW